MKKRKTERILLLIWLIAILYNLSFYLWNRNKCHGDYEAILQNWRWWMNFDYVILVAIFAVIILIVFCVLINIVYDWLKRIKNKTKITDTSTE